MGKRYAVQAFGSPVHTPIVASSCGCGNSEEVARSIAGRVTNGKAPARSDHALRAGAEFTDCQTTAIGLRNTIRAGRIRRKVPRLVGPVALQQVDLLEEVGRGEKVAPVDIAAVDSPGQHGHSVQRVQQEI